MPYLVGYATPFDYGAAGNGTTDDTSAVQAAINAVSAAGGGVVYFPSGTYKLSSALSMPNLVSLLGAGPGASVLNQTSTTANAITYNPATLNYVSVQNLTIQGPGSGSGVGMLVEANSGAASVTSCSFQDLTITGFGSHGLEIINGVGCSIATVNVNSVGGHAFFISGGTGLSLTGCYANGSTSTQQGFNLTNASHATLTGCRAYKTGGGYLLSGGSTNAVVGCGADTITAQAGQDGSGFKISGGTGHSLTTCYSTVNNAVAYYVTGTAVAALIEGVQETAPGGSATASIKVDTGSTTTIVDYSVVTTTSLAANTSTILVGSTLALPSGGTATLGATSVTSLTASGNAAVSGTLAAGATTVTGGETVSGNLTVGTASALGDNGVGELQLANVTAAPTTNPTGGVVVYAQSSAAAPVKMRDTAGIVHGLADGVALAATDQSVTSSTQTASTYLTLAVEASATYLMEAGVIFTNTTSGNNIVFSWTGPSNTTLKWNDTGTSTDYQSTISGTNSYASNAANRMAFLKGNLVTSTTTGSLTLTFSSSNGTNTVSVLTSSWLRLTRIR